MDEKIALDAIQRKFQETRKIVKIKLVKGGYFQADMTENVVRVNNLGSQPFLPWSVFEETVRLLIRNGGRAERGSALGGRLGDRELPLDSVEGHIAHTVYGKQVGETVFRRVVAVAAILIWAGICEAAPGELVLKDRI
jgi:hypothetical protein